MGIMVFGLFASTLSQLIAENVSENWSVGGFAVGAATIAGVIQAIRWGWDPFVAPLIGKALKTSRVMVKTLLVVLFSGGIVFIFLGNAASLSVLLPALLVFQLISTAFVTTSDTMAASTAAKTDRVKMMTAYTIVVDIGAAIGPLISFFLLDITSIALVYTLAGGLLLVVGLSWLVVYVRNGSVFST
ncbi:hypothetical protein [Sediminibacillus halophilus]|uniref:hypothetical protein n=1 Tax=Sediminibacillus halophilus TaxID=482461 RepID=UPI000B2C4681|nr:hypothetical protein [Sediminibacillus halophilus]